MSEYWVRLPIAGVIAVNVEAEDEESAIRAAFESDWNINLESKNLNVELDELDTYEHITQGNVLYAPLNEPEAEEA